MKEHYFWGIPRLTGGKMGIIVRIGLALLVTIGSIAFAWTLLSSHKNAHATGIVETSTTQKPWGLTFDKSGHVWVAEPGCLPQPVCSPVVSGSIGEFNTSNDSKVQEYSSAPATYMPVFLAVDGSGNVWFTDPTNSAIGELVPGVTPSWHEWITPGVEPSDLTFDGAGNIWFTEHGVNQIGFFNPGSHTFQENLIGTFNTRPYGIVYDSANNVVWFADSNTPNIGSFTPTANGVLGTVTMHPVVSRTSSFPYLITLDQHQNVWYSEGFAGYIGELPHGSTTATDFAICPSQPCGDFIAGIAVDSNGIVWLNNSQYQKVGALNPTSDIVIWVTLPNSSTANPRDGLGVDSANNVWFTDQRNSQLGMIPGSVATPTPTASSTAPVTPTNTPSPTPTPPPGNIPVSTQWFFGEGRVGAGFTEWLTLGNPTSNPCQVNLQYHSTSDGGVSNSKALVVPVPANTRVTQSVNQDLGISATSGGNSVSTTVTVDTTATPQCTGIVAERPIYNTTFGNPLGVNSGTDVIGATHTGTSFYFADVRTNTQAGGGSVSSFIPILNPGATTANVTATYFVGGSQVGSQTLAVPAGTRGTIYPGRATPSLPARVAAQVTSDQPVLVERPSYFNQVVAGNAGTVSGDADVVGVQQPAADFLFAEGYTGGQFQEYLVLANFGSTDIGLGGNPSGTLKLEYDNGTTLTFPISVGHLDQTSIDINQLTANPSLGTCTTSPQCTTSPNVSIEVTTPAGTSIVAERELFFHYSHTANGRSLSATGVSDVIGQVGPAAATAYSFAEGYTNSGYDEWLTLQNPTASPETITVNLANADGRTYPFQVTVGANTRSTVDITAMVIQHLLVAGDSFKGYEVSMSLSSTGPFVAERPMYFNASGYQGGDDQIGYTGG